MKKLKIRSKEIRRLGLSDEKAVRLAINLAAKHYRRDEKLLALGHLKELISNPDKYPDHENFAELALQLVEKKPANNRLQPKKVKLKTTASDFVVYGKENIDPQALDQMYTAMKMPVSVKVH